MNRLSGWWAGKSDPAALKKAENEVAQEKVNLQHALDAGALLMNDDLEGAIEELAKRDSAYHDMGSAVTFFMRSVLGFEKEAMAEAASKLMDVENRAWAEMKRLQKRGKVKGGSELYHPGTEMEVVMAQSQLMSAVVGVLHENLVEGMKSFYKIRKAFITLDAIMRLEAKEIERRKKLVPAAAANQHNAIPSGSSDSDGPDTDTPAAQTTAQTTPERSSLDDDNGITSPPMPTPLHPPPSFGSVDSDLQLDNPIDIFIHSGSNMCFGMIMLILSLMPPAFSRILSVVGFRGDRAGGVRMLWRSASHLNLNGAVAALMLLAYYNGMLGAVDILPHEQDYDEDAECVGPPREKCIHLLDAVRAQFPASRLWRVQESILYANEGNIHRAIELLTTGDAARMKQVAALNNFELSIDSIIIQDWNMMRDNFLKCLEMNDWSPAMYYYMAGSASLELYRDAVQSGDESQARVQKKKADGYFKQTPNLIGKKRLMARQLPLETFIQRKIQRWESRAKDLKIDLVDAIGASPALEMAYMWNGQKRMGETEKQKALKNLEWDRCTGSKETIDKIRAEEDEVAVWAICRASFLKGLGRVDEARELLEDNITKHDKAIFKGLVKNDWVMPTALYELATLSWAECSLPLPEGSELTVDEYRKQKTEECKALLERAKGWEAYVLDARIGMRVQSGLETVAWFKRKMGWVV